MKFKVEVTLQIEAEDAKQAKYKTSLLVMQAKRLDKNYKMNIGENKNDKEVTPR